jgi:hypothetical protein
VGFNVKVLVGILIPIYQDGTKFDLTAKNLESIGTFSISPYLRNDHQDSLKVSRKNVQFSSSSDKSSDLHFAKEIPR